MAVESQLHMKETCVLPKQADLNASYKNLLLSALVLERWGFSVDG